MPDWECHGSRSAPCCYSCFTTISITAEENFSAMATGLQQENSGNDRQTNLQDTSAQMAQPSRMQY
jgi:hypothetical protein